MKMNLFFSLPYELQLMIRDILKKDFNQKKCILEKNLHFPEVDFTFSRPVYTNGSVYEVYAAKCATAGRPGRGQENGGYCIICGRCSGEYYKHWY